MKSMITTSEYFIYGLNALLLLVILYLAIRITQSGITYMWNPGDEDLKHVMKIIILKCLLTILAIGLFATIINLLVGVLG